MCFENTQVSMFVVYLQRSIIYYQEFRKKGSCLFEKGSYLFEKFPREFVEIPIVEIWWAGLCK